MFDNIRFIIDCVVRSVLRIAGVCATAYLLLLLNACVEVAGWWEKTETVGCDTFSYNGHISLFYYIYGSNHRSQSDKTFFYFPRHS